MKRAKLILPCGSPKAMMLNGSCAKLVDADTGEEIECCGSITLNIPIDGVIVAQTNISISEIEIAADGE